MCHDCQIPETRSQIFLVDFTLENLYWKIIRGFSFFFFVFFPTDPKTQHRMEIWKKKNLFVAWHNPLLRGTEIEFLLSYPLRSWIKSIRALWRNEWFQMTWFSHNLTCETQIRTVITQSTEIQQQHKTQLTFNLFRKSS